MSGRAVAVFACFVALPWAGLGCGGESAGRARPAVASERAKPASSAPERVARFGRFEHVVRAPAPGDAVVARWIAPSGRSLETVAFDAPDGAHVRFSPAEIGVYRYELFAARGGERRTLLHGAFLSTASESLGMVHAGGPEPFRLAFDDGTPFFALGENRINIYDPSWNYGRKSIADYVAYMADNGMTTLRVFIPADCVSDARPDGKKVGCLEPRLGVFDDAAAKVYDEILEAAERHGIYVVLTVNAVGFTPGDLWKGWEGNPYSRARGGPAESPLEVFTRDDLSRAAEEKLDYVINRYGYSSHLLAIDLLNEPEWDGQIPESLWVPWAERLAKHVKNKDPYGHIITVGSVGIESNIDGDERGLYQSNALDLIQWHLYGQATYDPYLHAVEMASRVKKTFSFGKPVLCGEFAYGGEDPSLYDHTHTGLWAAAFAGGGALAHSAPPFNIDSDEPMTPDRARNFGVLVRFLKGVDVSRGLAPEEFAGRPGDLRVYALGRNDYKALWLLAPHASYGDAVEHAEVNVTGLVGGSYQVAWYSDTTGERLGADRQEVQSGEMRLAVPSFRRHVAAVISKVP